jgi:hypothetical protein
VPRLRADISAAPEGCCAAAPRACHKSLLFREDRPALAGTVNPAWCRSDIAISSIKVPRSRRRNQFSGIRLLRPERGGVHCSHPLLGFCRCISSTVNRYVQPCLDRWNGQDDDQGFASAASPFERPGFGRQRHGTEFPSGMPIGVTACTERTESAEPRQGIPAWKAGVYPC